jgi:hypothetical protein
MAEVADGRRLRLPKQIEQLGCDRVWDWLDVEQRFLLPLDEVREGPAQAGVKPRPVA